MSITLLQIPNDPADWPAWLETELVGVHLHQLICQLRLVMPERRESTLADILDQNDLSTIAAGGLSSLSQRQLGQLLSNPTALLGLQEFVFSHGRAYWQSIPTTPSHQQRANAILANVQEKVGLTEIATATAVITPKDTPAASSPSVGGGSGSRTRRAFLSSLAAATVIGLAMWVIKPAPKPSWGFSKSDLENADVANSDEYFSLLADAGNEWFKKRPQTPAQLRTRLTTFSAGCQVLIDAPHPQLAANEREWLVTKCQAWKDRIDGLVVSLDQAPANFEQIQSDADDVINRLVSALRSGPV